MDKVSVKYFNRDFEQTKKELINYTKAYYPTTFKDFSPASPGMLFIQQAAYISDVLNYYLDKQIKQNFILRAQQKKSIYDNAQAQGYQIRPVTPAYCEIKIQCIVQAITVDGNILPNLTKAPIISPGMLVSSINNPSIIFRVSQLVNFKELRNSDNIQPYFTQGTQDVQYFLLTKYVQSYAVIEKQFKFLIGDNVTKYLKITLPQQGVVKILSVVDSDQNKNHWYEVPFLSQTLIINPDQIQTIDGLRILKKIRTNRKFIKRLDYNDYTYLQFGINKQQYYIDQQILQNIYNVGSQNLFTDPSKYIYSSQYGLIPRNTQLTITYLVGQGSIANISTNELITINSYFLINQSQLDQITIDSLFVNNETPAIIGRDVQSLQQIKINTIAFSNSQNRTVTQQDYLARIRRLPAQYGYISKSFVRRVSKTGNIHIHLLTYDMNKKLIVVPEVIKNNVAQYLQLYSIMGDRLTITDAYIINIVIQFTISTHISHNKKEVLFNCLQLLRDYFKIQNFQINSYINLSQIKNFIMRVAGVSNLNSFIITNKTGSNTINGVQYVYSNVYYQILNATKNGIIYPSIDPSIFQVKYPEYDIIGTVL